MPAKALTVACVLLLCVFGAGPAAATAAESRPATTAPAEPSDGSSDPAPDVEARPALRTFTRDTPEVRRPPVAVFHVKRDAHPIHTAPDGAVAAGSSRQAVRSVVLRC
ncbi:hypothetical protein GCM10010347_41050 [Streptomyces cirratus]|uniref:Secreted protein n=2 Tax=Streptomyces cirratus TaxID=68187 RepID=A0ABQ3EVU7_9ACTN|nr:hypothetical protein GCM10010347_41050 [Streptomyces cirratus]